MAKTDEKKTRKTNDKTLEAINKTSEISNNLLQGKVVTPIEYEYFDNSINFFREIR